MDVQVTAAGGVAMTNSVADLDANRAMSPSPSVIDVTVRPCEEQDIPSVTRIYAHHVLHGLASFEVEPPSKTERCGNGVAASLIKVFLIL